MFHGLRAAHPPRAGQLAAVESALSASWLVSLQASLKSGDVGVGLPKLDVQTSYRLGATLRSLGMNAAFTGSADFSGTRPGISVTEVIHKAVLEVGEKGTVAAAATSAMLAGSAPAVLDASVAFDHPYLIAIVDAPTGALLFLGRVVDPTAH